MKKIVNLTIIMALAMMMSSNVIAQKIAYINADSLVVKMPEFTIAQKQIEEYAQQKQKLIQLKEQQIVAFQQELQLIQNDVSEKVWGEKVAQLQRMQQEFQYTQQQAQQDITVRENAALNAIYARINSALVIVAKEKGYAYIADKKMFLYAQVDKDVTEAVKVILGL
jgi:outer membrane protein